MPKGEKVNPKSLPTKGRLSLRRRQRMDFKRLQVNRRRPQKEKHSPAAPPKGQEEAKAAASGEQVPAAGAQSNVPALPSPDCPSGPSTHHGAAQAPGGQRAALAAPEPRKGTWDNEGKKRKVCGPRELCRRKNHIQQELSRGEVNSLPELYQGGSDSDKRSSHESWERITIRTIWVNPRYPELLQDLRRVSQEEAKAAAPPASDEQLPAAGAQSPVPAPASPCCSPCSSSARLAAQTLSKLQDVHTQPSRSMRALRALCSLFGCSCIPAQPEE